VRAILSCFEDNRDFLVPIRRRQDSACGAKSSERLMEKFRENHKRVGALLDRALGPADRKNAPTGFPRCSGSAAAR